MIKILLFTALLLTGGIAPAFAQTLTQQPFKSEHLKQDRKIRIRLPASYDTQPQKRYPLILALDGEYLFYSAIGAAAILEIYERMPESIIVAVDQNYPDASGKGARWNDCAYDEKTAQLKDSGRQFRSFLTEELLPHIDRTYRTTPFKALVGHSFTATYLSFFLTDPQSPFRAYVAISPYMPTSLYDPVGAAAAHMGRETWYFASTAEQDLGGHRKNLLELNDAKLAKIDDANFHYRFEDYPGANHMSIVNRSMETALGHVFERYSVLRREEAERADFRAEPIQYLTQKYADSERIYGVKVALREADLANGGRALLKQKDWPALRKLGEYTRKTLPKSFQGDLMLANYYEGTGQLKEAIAAQQTSCTKIPSDSRARKQCDREVERLQQNLNGGGAGAAE